MTAPVRPALFERYPDLEGRIPWIPLGTFPTPVQRLANCGHDRLWIKREDLSSPLYGGNKVRKLEFALGEALAKKAVSVTTMGGTGTNHGLATAIFCKKLGLGCRLVLFDQPVTRYVRHNLSLFHYYGAELIHSSSLLGAGMRLVIWERLRPGRNYVLYAGGSSPLGALGITSALFELKKQIDAGQLPEPRYLFCPVGSSGTMAGISLGVLLAGMNTEVIGVRVSLDRVGPVGVAGADTVRSLMRQSYALLRKNSSMVPDVRIPLPMVLDDYFGEGYGCPTPECRAALAFLKEREGIKLDPTYTGKTFAAVIDFIRDGAHAGDPILYWHTYNSVDLAAQAASVDYHELPAPFHRLFEGKEVEV